MVACPELVAPEHKRPFGRGALEYGGCGLDQFAAAGLCGESCKGESYCFSPLGVSVHNYNTFPRGT